MAEIRVTRNGGPGRWFWVALALLALALAVLLARPEPTDRTATPPEIRGPGSSGTAPER